MAIDIAINEFNKFIPFRKVRYHPTVWFSYEEQIIVVL